jgi:hypothetical protein
MATGRQLKAAILVRRAAKGPRKRRTRPEPRQYTVADLERARDRVAAAERRIDNDRTSNPNRGRAGLERAQLELSVISRNYACAASLSDGSLELSRHPGQRVEGPRSPLARPNLVPILLQKSAIRRASMGCEAIAILAAIRCASFHVLPDGCIRDDEVQFHNGVAGTRHIMPQPSTSTVHPHCGA